MSEDTPDAPELLEYASPPQPEAPPPDPSTAGAKLFVIFFLTVVPLLGMAIIALILYRLFMH